MIPSASSIDLTPITPLTPRPRPEPDHLSTIRTPSTVPPFLSNQQTMAPNIHSLNSPKKRSATGAHKTASGRSTKKPRRYRSGNTTSDDDDDDDEEEEEEEGLESEVRTITEMIGGGRAAGKRAIKPVPAPIGGAAPGPSKSKQTSGKVRIKPPLSPFLLIISW